MMKDCQYHRSLSLRRTITKKITFVILLDYGAQVDLPGSSASLTALQAAARSGRVNIMEMLLQAGANPNVRSKKILENRTPLHFLLFELGETVGGERVGSEVKVIADEELKNIIALLVAKGADINAVDKNGNNIIHYLTMQCKADLIRYAVSNGCRHQSRE